MAFSSSANCVKYLLFGFNFLFVVTGIIILSVGLTIQGIYHGYSNFLDEQFFSLPVFLIVIGSIIFFISFFGCWGAMKSNYCMVITFSFMLVLVFILELAAGISGYVLKGQTYNLLTNTISATMPFYGDMENHTDLTISWDHLQTGFSCCGLTNYTDWHAALDNKIPMSCCTTKYGAIDELTCRPESPNLYETGCIKTFGDFIKAHTVTLAAVGISLAVIQFIGIFFACFIARQIKNNRGY